MSTVRIGSDLGRIGWRDSTARLVIPGANAADWVGTMVRGGEQLHCFVRFCCCIIGSCTIVIGHRTVWEGRHERHTCVAEMCVKQRGHRKGRAFRFPFLVTGVEGKLLGTMLMGRKAPENKFCC